MITGAVISSVVSLALAVISGAVAGLIAWGAQRAEVRALRAELRESRTEIREVRRAVDAAHARTDQLMIMLAGHVPARQVSRDDRPTK